MQFRNEKRDREEEIRTTKAVSRNTHNRELVILKFVLAIVIAVYNEPTKGWSEYTTTQHTKSWSKLTTD